MYQFAAGAFALILFPADVWSYPTTSRASKVMATEVVAISLRVCDCQMVRGSVEQQSGPRASTLAWEFNSACDCIVGAHMFGIAEDGPGDQVSMLRFTTGGTAREVGEMLMAFSPDSLRRATRGGCFAAQAAASE